MLDVLGTGTMLYCVAGGMCLIVVVLVAWDRLRLTWMQDFELVLAGFRISVWLCWERLEKGF